MTEKKPGLYITSYMLKKALIL